MRTQPSIAQSARAGRGANRSAAFPGCFASPGNQPGWICRPQSRLESLRYGRQECPRYAFGRATRPVGFTLIEVLLALAICAIVMVAINAVFATAVHLRDRTTAVLEESIPINRALELLRNDLKGTVGPGGFLAGDFKCGAQSMGTSMGLSGEAGGGGLDFYTSTGHLSETAPWGDIQEVFYELQRPANRDESGMDLVRCVNRNLLATTTQTPDVQWLMGGVETVQFDCYDGTQWRGSWDTSLSDTNLPAAVRVRIQLAPKPGEDARYRQPLEMIVPLLAQTIRTNSASTNSSGGGL